MCHLLLGQDRARFVLVRGVPHQGSVAADQEGHLVAEILELAQLAHGDGMTEMQVGRGWVVAAVDAQRAAFLFSIRQTLAQLTLHGLLQFFIPVFGALHQ